MLRLSKVAVENFRGIERLEVEFDEATVLIGENNVGKTSVLEALSASLGQDASRRGPRFQDYDHRRAGPDRELPDGHRIAVTLTFEESVDDPWPDDFAQALNDVIQLDDAGGRSIVMQVRDTYDEGTRSFESETVFLNRNEEELRPPGTPARMLRRFAPLFYLPADRSAASGFRPGARFWGPFLRDPQLSNALREDLERRLRELNEEVIQATPRLGPLRERLNRARELVDLAESDPASLEPLPGRIPELLRRTEVRLSTPTGASIPLDRHGGGTQNIAVLFLFEAYLASVLAEEFEQATVPILAVEEPEAHLHPAAVRSTWRVLEQLTGQKIVATHSGELLSRAPLSSLRRLVRRGSKIEVYRLRSETLTDSERRKVDFHVRRARGELLFARVWLLGEGETEFWVLQAAAEAHGVDLEQMGVRVVDSFAQAGALPLAKVADDLGIKWHFVVDDDDQGGRTKRSLEPQLSGRPEQDHITVLGYTNIEQLLCEEGFGDLYEAALSPEQESSLSSSPGDDGYWQAVASTLNSRQKTTTAALVADEMRQGSRPVPPSLIAILDVVKRLSQS